MRKILFPDFYMNLLIGLAYKYYGEQTICDLFNYWRGDVKGVDAG